VDVWERWLSVDRFTGSGPQEVEAGLALIDQIRGWLLQESRLGPGQTVLELGCGGGEFLPRLLDVVGPEGRVLALEHSAGLCARARAGVAGHPGADRCTVTEGDMRHIPFDSASVDVVVCRAVLQYAERDLPLVAAEVARVLRPGGRIVAFEVLPGDSTPLLPVPAGDAERRAHAAATARWQALPYALGRADLVRAFGPPAFLPAAVTVNLTEWRQPFSAEAFGEILLQVPRPGCPPLHAVYTEGLAPDLRAAWDRLLAGATTAAQRGAVGYLSAQRAATA
jgi:SAM-dependent methyltransferase